MFLKISQVYECNNVKNAGRKKRSSKKSESQLQKSSKSNTRLGQTNKPDTNWSKKNRSKSHLQKTSDSHKLLSERISDTIEYYTEYSDVPFKSKVKSVAKERIGALRKFYPKVASKTVLSEHIEKPNYQAYDVPTPGPGLQLYQQRLMTFICNNYYYSNQKKRCSCSNNKKVHFTKNKKEPMELCNCACCTNISKPEDFFRIFPPQNVCPENKPKYHKLSFVDDPPYSYDPDTDAFEYCRYTLPQWVQNGVEEPSN